MLWWLFIARLAVHLGKNLQDKHLTAINQLSALILGAFAAYTLLWGSKAF
jgi:hypothetical protein